MKKIILFSILLITASASFSQQTTPSPILTKQDYLKKSKHQKTAAWILVSSGALFSVLGSTELNFGGTESGQNSNNTFFLVTGFAAIGTSIPFFIASSKNKKKAMSLSFKPETAPQLANSHFIYWPVPSLTFRVSL